MASFKDVFKVVPPEQESSSPVAAGEGIHDSIRNDVDGNRIVIFMKGTADMPECGFSAATVEVFHSLGVPFETRNVLADPELRQGIKEFSNWPTIPQVFISGKFIGGCDIIQEMHANGELEPIVREALGN